ncbi:MAG: replication restart helicase PriA [Nitrospiraceae bacterium]
MCLHPISQPHLSPSPPSQSLLSGLPPRLIVPLPKALLECRMTLPKLGVEIGSPNSTLPLSYANVIVPRHLSRSFTYRIPSELRGRLSKGSLVLVPFGQSKLQGVVVALLQHLPAELKERNLRPIHALVENIADGVDEAARLELSHFVSERYLAPWGQCLRLVLPPQARPVRNKLRYALTKTGKQASDSEKRLTPIALEILRRLVRRPSGLSFLALTRTMRRPERTLTMLERRGWIEAKEDRHDAMSDEGKRRLRSQRKVETSCDGITLTADLLTSEPAWQTVIREAFEKEPSSALLIQAPDRYRLACLFQTMEDILARDRAILVVTGEVTRASYLAGYARVKWGDRVAIMHSGVSHVAKAETWARCRDGLVKVLIGTRSAVFAPVKDVGVIWIEREEEGFLKEEQEPHYHAREVARFRAVKSQALLVLSSAHPSLETLCETEGRGKLLSRHTDPEEQPAIQVVDLRLFPRGTLLTPAMTAGIKQAVENNAGVILFLNRKGYAGALICRECGGTPSCPRCSVTLTFYRQSGRLSCHYCGQSSALPNTCPSCLAARLEPVGFGTERLEEETRRLFPEARIVRLDRGVVARPKQEAAIRRLACAGEFDVIIGTQLLFHGDPLPTVGFVGVPYADGGLHLPDFRSAERTYHDLLDLASLAHPRHVGGKVMIQTYLPTHHAIQGVASGVPDIFHTPERQIRAALDYPPYSHLMSLRISGRNAVRVEMAACRWAELLKQEAGRLPRNPHGAADSVSASDGYPERTELSILGPVPAPVFQVRGQHRWQLLVKGGSREGGRFVVQTTLDAMEQEMAGKDIKFDVDVDPVD